MFSKVKNYTIKSAAVLLSATTIISTGAPNASAAAVATSQNNRQTGIIYKGKKFIKKHPLLTGGAVIVGGCFALRHQILRWGEEKWLLRNVTTAIDNLSPKEIDEEISRQVQIYIDRAPDVFEFDDDLKAKIDHKILLLSLMKINYLFDKYEPFTHTFIQLKRENELDQSRKFRLQVGKSVDYKKRPNAVMGTTLSHMDFMPDKQNSYDKHVYNAHICVEHRFLRPVDNNHLADSTITHEFGHLIERTYREVCIADNGGIPGRSVTTGLTDESIKYVLEFYPNIQNDILQGLEGDARIISDYGETNASEFFAEAFAHLECTDNPDDVNEIGRRTESYLVNTMGFLPREKSKFNK